MRITSMSQVLDSMYFINQPIEVNDGKSSINIDKEW